MVKLYRPWYFFLISLLVIVTTFLIMFFIQYPLMFLAEKITHCNEYYQPTGYRLDFGPCFKEHLNALGYAIISSILLGEILLWVLFKRNNIRKPLIASLLTTALINIWFLLMIFGGQKVQGSIISGGLFVAIPAFIGLTVYLPSTRYFRSDKISTPTTNKTVKPPSAASKNEDYECSPTAAPLPDRRGRVHECRPVSSARTQNNHNADRSDQNPPAGSDFSS